MAMHTATAFKVNLWDYLRLSAQNPNNSLKISSIECRKALIPLG